MPRKQTALGKPPSRRPGRVEPPRRRSDQVGLAAIPRGRRDPDDPLAIATREAGHAVAAVVLGLPLRSVDVRRRNLPDGRTSVGYTDCPIPGTSDFATLANAMVQVMSGPLAEDRVNASAMVDGCHDSDMEQVHRLAAIAVCESTTGVDGRRRISPGEIRRKLARIGEVAGEAVGKADRLVEAYWAAIRETARLLVDGRALTAEEVAAVVASHPAVGTLPASHLEEERT